jgi:hypothetical protein
VVIGEDEIEWILQQVGPLQFNIRFGQRLVLVDERKIQFPAGKSWNQALAVVIDHGQVDVGMALAEARDGARDQRRNGSREAGEPQPSTPQASDLAEFLLGLVQAREHRLGVRQEDEAGVGEAYRPHAPFHQPRPCFPLEGGDLLADRRLGERQRLRRRRERAAGGDFSQHTEATWI